jgi:hypothetical protein
VKRIRHATVVLPEGVVVFNALLLSIVTKGRDKHLLRTVGARPLAFQPEANAHIAMAVTTKISDISETRQSDQHKPTEHEKEMGDFP